MNHRLVPALVVNDAQASVYECDIDDRAVFADGAIAEPSLPVGAAVLDGFVEDVEPLLGDRFERRRRWAVHWVVDLDDTRDATHYDAAFSS